jgi:hypothetical protein
MTRLDAWSQGLMDGWRSPERADVETTLPDAWSQRMAELLDLRTLEDDWDGQGAKAPSAALMDSAIQLAGILRQQGMNAPCRIVPGVNGTVIFEWQQGDIYREMELTTPDRAEMLEMTPGQPPKHWIVRAET